MAKSIFEKAIERAVVSAAGVWGRKAANLFAEKAQGKAVEVNAARKTKKKSTINEEPSDEEGSDDNLEMIE